jgi:membrane protein
MTQLLEQMVAAGWVGRVHAEDSIQVIWGRGAREGGDGWVLLVDPGSIRLADVYRRFVFSGAGMDLAPGTGAGAGAGEPVAASPLAVDTAALARQVEAAVERGLDQTLAEHFAAVSATSSASPSTSANTSPSPP